MSEIEIRKAETRDADAISIICSKDLGYPCETSFVTRKIENLDDNREAAYVAIADGSAVGYIHVEKYDTLYFETMANILGLAVLSEYQHQGIGQKLIGAAETWAVENGIKMMRLNSGISRTGAHAFYQHLGYDSGKEQLRFTKRL